MNSKNNTRLVKTNLTKSNEDTIIPTWVDKDTQQSKYKNEGDDAKHQSLCDCHRVWISNQTF